MAGENKMISAALICDEGCTLMIAVLSSRVIVFAMLGLLSGSALEFVGTDCC